MTYETPRTLSWPMRHHVAVNMTPADMGIMAAALDDCESKGDDETCDILAHVILGEQIAEITAGQDASDVAYHIVHALRRMI